MSESTDRKWIKVFLASPSDLAPERKRAIEVVGEVNRAISRHSGYSVDLLIWEDVPPGAGRPQELINPMVDSCDVFVGLLWTQWGNPTGRFESGFEEEFRRAMELRAKGDAPEVWLAFKKLLPSQIRDPGTELSKVLEFKNAQKKSQLLLYREFNSTNDWCRQFREWLLSYVFKKISTRISETAASITNELYAVVRKPSAEGDASFEHQLTRILGVLSEKVRSPMLDDSDVDRWDCVRLQLFTASLTANQTEDRLGIHDTNLLYLHRARGKFSEIETQYIFESMLSSNDDVVPGWYWFRKLDEEALERKLFLCLSDTADNQTKKNIAKLLAFAKLPPLLAESSAALIDLVNDPDDDLKVLIIRYMQALGDHRFRPLIKGSISGLGGRVDEAAQLALSLISDGSSVRPVKLVDIGTSELTAETLAVAKSQPESVSTAVLRSALASQNVQVRHFAADTLHKRLELTEADAEALSNDAKVAVRSIGLCSLIEAGKQFSASEIRQSLKSPSSDTQSSMAYALFAKWEDQANADDVVRKAFARRDVEFLKSQLDWVGEDGLIAYSLLAERNVEFAGRVRTDIIDDFNSLRAELLERTTGQYGAMLAKWLDDKKEIDQFIRRRFRREAFTILAKSPDLQAAEIARGYLANAGEEEYDETLLGAIQVIRVAGGGDDVGLLIDIAVRIATRAKVLKAAIDAAASLTSPIDTIKAVLTVTDAPVVLRYCLRTLRKCTRTDTHSIVRNLLQYPESDVRLSAIGLISMQSSDVELEVDLATYLREGTYYYNVVCWLDRILYSPTPLRIAYRKYLIEKLIDQ